eukprot:Em0019g285a
MIAATEHYSELVITWVTFDSTSTSQVLYGLTGEPLWNVAYGSETEFVHKEGKNPLTRYIHRVNLTNLLPLIKYDYICGSPANWSKLFTTRTLGDGTSPTTLAVFGDMGYKNGQSIPWLISEATNGTIDGVLHCGDIAYNLFNDGGRNGDDFINAIERISSKVPYMVAPGNHEWLHNFSDYRYRFSMPGNTSNGYYSWNVGSAHIISLTTEIYFFLWDGIDLIKEQYDWLVQDLQKATSEEQRAKYPWIITMAHHPMYCSTTDEDDCNHRDSVVRVGLPVIHKYGLESLFYEYGVDVALWGHEHIYERLWPVYDYKVMNGTNPYHNTLAPVHIISGAAGCREGRDLFMDHQPDWAAFISREYGYSKMTIHNITHLSIDQISISQNGTVIDTVTLSKDPPI